MHPDQIDLTAAGTHAYAAKTQGVTVRITVDPDELAHLGLTVVEEPLFVRRTVELLPEGTLAASAPEVTLGQLGARIEGYPAIVEARLRN